MIAYVIDIVVKPGSVWDCCRAIQDKLPLWRAQPGFVDEIVLADSGANHVVAQTFWRSKEDAGQFDRVVCASVQEFASAPPQSGNYCVAISTNRNIVPERGGAAESMASAQTQSGGLAAQAMKVPPTIFVSGLEFILRLSRGAQSVYNDAIDGVLDTASGPANGRAQPAAADLVRDTLSGLIAFVVPGPDAYSAAQGVSTAEAGGLDAGILDILIEALNRSQPSLPGGPPPAAGIAGALNQIAQELNAAATGPFLSPFACLSFRDKTRVFQAIEANPQTRALAAVLPLTAFLVYSEAGVFDRERRTMRARPLGWSLSGYEGVADGRNEFKGYYRDRRSVETSDTMASR